MKTLLANYEILNNISNNGIDELKFIEKVGRTCYKSEDKILEDGKSALTFNKMLVSRNHEAMLEHSFLSVKFYVDRGVSHEFVRHREASFAQESTRYCSYDKDKFGNEITFIDIAPGISLDSKMKNLPEDQIGRIIDIWYAAMKYAEDFYLQMIEAGATPQIARSVLPNSTKTELVITANYREWRHILKLRTAKDAHPQIREVCIKLLDELKTRIPVVFDDIDVEM